MSYRRNEVVVMIDDMQVYIANLGKYNEGYLVGAWFSWIGYNK